MFALGHGSGIPGVDQRASLYKLGEGWLVSYQPKDPEPPKLEPAKAEEIREARRRALKRSLGEQAAGMALAGKLMKGSTEGDENWKGDPVEGVGKILDDVVDKLVPADDPVTQMGFGHYVPCGNMGVSARAFPTLEDALAFLKEVL